MCNALRWMGRAGAPWCLIAHGFPPWEAAYQQTQRWLQAGCGEAMVNGLHSVLRVAQGKQGQPSAVILDDRTLQSTCESGPRAGNDGCKRKEGSKVQMALDTLGHCPLCRSRRPTNKSVRKRGRWHRRFSTRPATR